MTSWNRHEKKLENETIQMAESIGALFDTKQIKQLVDPTIEDSDKRVAKNNIETILTRLTNQVDLIKYSLILSQHADDFNLAASSKIDDQEVVHSVTHEVKEMNDIILYSFASNDSVATNRGESIRVLTPISDVDDEVLAVLGLAYSMSEWYVSVFERMIPSVINVIIINLLIFTLYNIYNKNKRLTQNDRIRDMVLSRFSGMAFRLTKHRDWSFDLISEGSYELLGYQPDELMAVGEFYSKRIYSNYFNEITSDKKTVENPKYYKEYEIITKDNKNKWVLEIGEGKYDLDHNLKAIEGVIFDITELKNKDFQIERLKNYDTLTDFYNRKHMELELDKLKQKNQYPFSVLICDIDGLSLINEVYGYENGNKLICWTGRAIKESLGEAFCTIGHMGGGQFLIHLPGVDQSEARKIKENIKKHMRKQIKYHSEGIYTTDVSIAYNTINSKDEDIEKLVTETKVHLKRSKLLKKTSSQSAVVSSLLATLYAKSEETEEHGQRLSKYCMKIGEQLDLPQSTLDDLLLLSKLHDIGKIGVDDQILNKPGRLTESEWHIMKAHPEIGYQIAMAIPQVSHIAQPILHHHERWDGTGYPKGLAGADIPLISRILTIVDAYDAMTNNRVYRQAMPKEEAIIELSHHAGSQFDPKLTELFIEILENE